MGNKYKIVGAIIAAFFVIALLAITIHFCTRKPKLSEDDHSLLQLSPKPRIESSYSNNTEEDQLVYIDAMLDSWNTDTILNAQRDLEHLCTENPDEPKYLYRLAKCYHHLVELDLPIDKHSIIQQGVSFCRRALKLDNHDAEIHKWYAILVGMRADLAKDTIKDRVVDGATFRRHAEVALELSPNDDCLYFVLGRYMFEVADLNWAERNLANWLFEADLSATYEDALKYFQKAADLNSNWKENMMYIGKCYNRMGLHEDGVKALQLARNLNGANKDLLEHDVDQRIEEELQQNG